MFRSTDGIVFSTTVSQLSLSAHYCVVTYLPAIKPVNHSALKQSGNLHSMDLDAFKGDICQLTPLTLCPSFKMLDASLRIILEKHAKMNSCKVSASQNDPRYKLVKSDIVAAKKYWHWTERQYLNNLV